MSGAARLRLEPLFFGYRIIIGAMPSYLLKTEPGVYSFSDLERDKETLWDGVTNPTAVKHLREMKAGEKLVIYHTGDERQAVGTATVTSVHVRKSQSSRGADQGG